MMYPDQTKARLSKELAAAIQVAKTGDKAVAREKLLAIAEEDPTNETAWLWLAGLATDLHEAKTYLETTLALNPHHKQASFGLAFVDQSLAKQAQRLGSPAKQVPAANSGASTLGETQAPLEVDTHPVGAKPQYGESPACATTATVSEEAVSPQEEALYVDAEISPSFSLSVEQAEAIDKCLDTMAYESEASCIILADVTGQLISERGETGGINTQVLSALAAGELSATQEMARLVGEEARFNLLLHEGERRSVYLSPVGTKMILIVVFRSQTPIGLVRIILKNAVDVLYPILDRGEAHSEGTILAKTLDNDFVQKLEDEISASLTGIKD